MKWLISWVLLEMPLVLSWRIDRFVGFGMLGWVVDLLPDGWVMNLLPVWWVVDLLPELGPSPMASVALWWCRWPGRLETSVELD